MPPRGLAPLSLPALSQAATYLANLLYTDNPPQRLVSKTNPKSQRNQSIRLKYEAGQSVPSLAREYGISKARVYEILKNSR